MNYRNILTIAKKDWLEVAQHKSIWMPMLIVPIIFVIIFPLVFTLVLPAMNISPQEVLASDKDIELFLDRLPPQLTRYIDFSRPMETMLVVILGIMFAPMFLILPLMFSTTIAAESFAGELERKTMEALLYTPVSDADLFLGKVAASAVPSIGITWACFFVYTLILNFVPYYYVQRLWFPLPTWWPLMFWVTPALVVLGIALTVLISARVRSFTGAYQTSSSTVLLVVLLFAGQLSGFLYLSVFVEMLIGLVVWLLAALLIYRAIKTFNRQALITGQ